MTVLEILRKMKTLRQIGAAELLAHASTHSVAYASAILAGPPQSQLVDSFRQKPMKGITP